MPRTLIAEEFNGGKLGKVAGFDCGHESWSQYAANWIQAPAGKPGAIQSIADRGTQVFLYFDEDSDQLVGFGSLGETKWPNFPDRVTLIPQLAIQLAFHGQPQGIGETKFSHQLLDDLIARAITRPPRHLVLTVDPGNDKARRLYLDFQFTELTDRSPRGHIKMALLLPEPLPIPAVGS